MFMCKHQTAAMRATEGMPRAGALETLTAVRSGANCVPKRCIALGAASIQTGELGGSGRQGHGCERIKEPVLRAVYSSFKGSTNAFRTQMLKLASHIQLLDDIQLTCVGCKALTAGS